MGKKKEEKKNNKKEDSKKTIDKLKKKVFKFEISAFTLIELLAVIIILGVIMLIAIPGVTRYITNSRKDAYIATVRRCVDGAKTMVNEATHDIYDVDTTYYIPVSCIKMERGEGKTPYGDFSKAYVVVVYTGSGYNYYYTGTDTSNTGIKNIVSYNDLNKKSIESNVTAADIKSDIGIDGRNKVVIFNEDCSEINSVSPNAFIDNEGNEVPIGEIPGHEYLNVNTGKYYGSLQSIINESESGNTIKVIGDVEENSTVTIPNTLSSLKIDFNGKKIFFDYNVYEPIINNSNLILNDTGDTQNENISTWTPIINNGSLEVNEKVWLRSENTVVDNHGTMNVKGGSIGSNDASGIDNYGTLNISGGGIGGYSQAVYNIGGTVNITSGSLSAYTGLYNCSTCTATLSGDGVIDGSSNAVSNEGTFIATGGKIKATRGYGPTGLYNKGTATLTNITIESKVTSSGFSTTAVENVNGATLTINSGTITSTVDGSGYKSIAIKNKGTLTINNGNISAISNRYRGEATGISLEGGTTTIKNGRIEATQYAVETGGNYTLTLGTNDGNVSTTLPELYAKGSSGIGITLSGTGVINFYDGIIKYANGVNYCIWGSGTPTINYPTGYTLHKEYNNPLGVGYLVAQ